MDQIQDQIIKTLKSFKDSIPQEIKHAVSEALPDNVLSIIDKQEERFKGPQGDRGPCGRGLEGPPGLRGISVSDISLTEQNNLIVKLSDGKEFYFKNNLKGDKGDRGEKGARGEKGSRGQRGKEGKTGPRGENSPLQFKGEWLPNKIYSRGDIVSYGQALWIATKTTSQRPKDKSSDWDLMISLTATGPKGGSSSQAVSATVEPWVGARFYPEYSTVTFDYKLYICKVAHTATLDFAADYAGGNWATETGVDTWATATSYAVNDVVTFGGYLYVCIAGHTSTTFPADRANWQASEKGLDIWETAKNYLTNDAVVDSISQNIFVATANHTSGTFGNDLSAGLWRAQNEKGVDAWETAKDYKVDDVVVFGSILYVCLTDHTSNIFLDELNANNWQKQKQVPAWQDSDFPYFIDDIITRQGKVYICMANHRSNDFDVELGLNFWRVISEQGISVWATTTTYLENDVVVEPVSHLIYAATANHSSTNFTLDKAAGLWASPESGVSLWVSGEGYAVDDAVIYDKEFYICRLAHTSNNFLTDLNNLNWVKQKQVPAYRDAGYRYFTNDVIAQDQNVYVVITDFVSTNFTADEINLKNISIRGIDLWETAKLYNINDTVIDGPNNDIYVCVRAHTSTIFNNDLANWKATFPLIEGQDSFIELLPLATNAIIPDLDFDLNDVASAIIDVVVKRKTDTEEIISKSVLYIYAMDTAWEGSQQEIAFIKGGVDGVTFSFTQAGDILQVRYTSTALTGTHNPDQSRLEYIIRSTVSRT
jgi:hypothetical protein